MSQNRTIPGKGHKREKMIKMTVIVVMTLVCVIGAALVYGLVSGVVQMNEKREVPTPDEARYSVTTASRVYYTSNAERVSDNLTILHGYWWLDNKVWRYDKGDLTLTLKYGKVNITRRTK